MKSPIVRDFSTDPDNYSDLQVLKSAAGYYIGTLYTNPEGSEMAGLVEPGSRDSRDYYETEADAQTALDNNTFIQRAHP